MVHYRHERLVAEGAVVRLADREADDADVVTTPADTDPVDPRVGPLGRRSERERAVREDVDLRARVGADQRPCGPERLGQPLWQITRPRRADGRQRAIAVAP